MNTTRTCIAAAWRRRKQRALNRTSLSCGVTRYLYHITIIIITITTLIILTIRHYHHHHQGHYNENSDLKIRALTQQEILDNVNNNNVSGIFLKVLVVDVVVVFKE